MDDLTAATEELNDAIRRAEAFFATFSVPVEIPFEEGTKLGFGKYNREWNLYVVDAAGNASALLTASRLLRTLAAHQLPAMHAAILAAGETTTRDVRAATAQIDAFLAARSVEALKP